MPTDKISYFIAFCIEQYKTEKGISGADAVQVLKLYGVLEYLAERDVMPTHLEEILCELMP